MSNFNEYKFVFSRWLFITKFANYSTPNFCMLFCTFLLEQAFTYKLNYEANYVRVTNINRYIVIFFEVSKAIFGGLLTFIFSIFRHCFWLFLDGVWMLILQESCRFWLLILQDSCKTMLILQDLTRILQDLARLTSESDSGGCYS